MDSKLWENESDLYTKRAIESHGDNLYLVDDDVDKEKIFNLIKNSVQSHKSILDIGCSYGRVVNLLKERFENTQFLGIDPGSESIRIANKNLSDNRTQFKQGHSDNLPCEDEAFDVVILFNVLQWVPREHLIRTIAEVDRVLRVGGVVYIQEYLPNKPLTSQSIHDDEIYIFKDDYVNFFIAFPWFREIYREVHNINDGEDQQRNISIVRKFDLNDVYQLKDGVREENE